MVDEGRRTSIIVDQRWAFLPRKKFIVLGAKWTQWQSLIFSHLNFSTFISNLEKEWSPWHTWREKIGLISRSIKNCRICWWDWSSSDKLQLLRATHHQSSLGSDSTTMKLHLNRNDMDLGIVKPRNKTNAKADEPLLEFYPFCSMRLCFARGFVMVTHEVCLLFITMRVCRKIFYDN